MATVRVLERWKDPFEEEEERAIFVANVFSQMEGDEREGENTLIHFDIQIINYKLKLELKSDEGLI